ncbi:hypothetical protein [Rhodoplanes sp. Z2-YC6860]|nr:hypothetical protein [Rhodoplanes sp. Z2-YC6860]
MSQDDAQSRNCDGTTPIVLDGSSAAVQNYSNLKHNRRGKRRQSLA